MAVLCASVVLAGTAAAAVPDPPPDEDPDRSGTQFSIPFYPEPEFLLVAGDERWNVRNRATGTVAAAYGRPLGGLDDAYMATARYPSLGTPSNKRLLDVSFQDKNLPTGSSWYFGRYDDGTAEVWGPGDNGFDERYLLRHFSYDIVGGMVQATQGGLPRSVVVLESGELAVYVGDSYQGKLADLSGAPGRSTVGGDAVAAVGRSFTKVGAPARILSTTRHLPDPEDPDAPDDPEIEYSPREVRDEEPADEDMLLVLRADGELVPIRIGDGSATDVLVLDELSTRFASLRGAAGLPDPVALDFDFTCGVFPTADSFVALPPTGDVAAYLGCDNGSVDERIMSFGRISAAIGVNSAPVSVKVVTAADTILASSGGGPGCATYGGTQCFYSFVSEIRNETGCELSPPYSYGQLPGAFDLRVAVESTHLACVEPIANQVRMHSYHQPQSATVLRTAPYPPNPAASAFPPAVERGAVRFDNLVDVRRTVVDRMHEPEPDTPQQPDAIVEEQYAAIQQPTVQLSFPCQVLLSRPTASGAHLDDCDVSTPGESYPPGLGDPGPEVPPRNWVSATIAGYGLVGDQPRLFVHNHPIEGHPEDAVFWDPHVEGGGLGDEYGPDNYAWTVEPAANLAADLAAVRADPTGPATERDTYVPDPAGPAPFLAQVGRPESEVVIELLSAARGPVETNSKPIAVLQAPPTVDGLGQQIDFTPPEFGVSSGSGTTNETSKSTRLGTHFGIDATFTAGMGIFGNGATVGGGFDVEWGHTSEFEESSGRSIEVVTSESYGGTFADHTVVVRSLQQYEWDAKVVEDPTGFATGELFTYAIPIGEVTQAIPLSTLAANQANLYGENGVFTSSLQRIVSGAVPGDVRSYIQGTATDDEPEGVLAVNGGPCKGGFTPPDSPTSTAGGLPHSLQPNSPYVQGGVEEPKGPSVVLSSRHAVQLGNDLYESAAIEITRSTEESLLSTISHDYSVSGIFTVEGEVSVGPATDFELNVTAGIDTGFSTGAGVTDTLSEGTSLEATMGNIPYTADDVGPWLERERYNWRMFMCKAQLGPIGLLTDVWVQGYVVDNYNGAGGLTELAPVAAIGPVGSAVVRADPTAQVDADTVVPQCAAGDVNEFRFDHDAGTVRSYRIAYENLTSGGRSERIVDLGLGEVIEPKQFNEAYQVDDDDDPNKRPRPECGVIRPGNLEDGSLYRWRTIADGFLGNSETTDWEFFRAQVFPPDQTLSIRRPVTLEDGSVLIDIDDPDGVTSLRHEIVVYREVEGASPIEVAHRSEVGSTYRTPVLEPGDYIVKVVGYNDHFVDGVRVGTPVVEQPFTVAERLEAQFRWSCVNQPCLTTEAVAFTDESSTALGVPIVSWDWDFGDGRRSSEENPEHIYGALPPDGSDGYDVTLRVVDAAGRLSLLTQRVRVAEPQFDLPVAAFTHDTCGDGADPETACAPTGSPVTFDAGTSTAPAGAISAWRWDFGDGTTAEVRDPAQSTITHVYDSPGDRRVQLRVADQLGQWSEPVSQMIGVANREPSVEVSSDRDFVVFEDEPAAFAASVTDPDGDPAAAVVTWQFGDSSPAEATGTAVTHTWDTPGTKTVEVTVVDEHGGVGRSTFEVTVLAGPVADFAWSCPFLGRCNVLFDTAFTDRSTDEQSPIIAWHWDFGDGTTSTLEHPTHHYWKVGTFPVTLTITDARGKRATTTKSINVTLI